MVGEKAIEVVCMSTTWIQSGAQLEAMEVMGDQQEGCAHGGGGGGSWWESKPVGGEGMGVGGLKGVVVDPATPHYN